MAFNPLKRNVEIPVPQEDNNESSDTSFSKPKLFNPHGNKSNTNTVSQEEKPVNVPHEDFSAQIPQTPQEEPSKPLQYEGQNIDDLEKSGISTVNFLKSVPSQNPKFNVPLLEALPLDFILEKMDAKKKYENKYDIYGQEISIKENKWYNTTQKKGNIKALSLIKHLTAIHENINEYENSKMLFISACKLAEQFALDFKNIHTNEINKKSNDSVDSKQANSKQTENLNDKLKNKTIDVATLSYSDIRAMKDLFNNLSISLIFEHFGSSPNSGGTRGKWKVWKTGQNIQATGEKWYNFNLLKGGVGAFSLTEHLIAQEQNIDERVPENKKLLEQTAMQELITHFGSDYDLSAVNTNKNNFEYKIPFYMPYVIDFKLNKVKQYLHEKRGLPKWLIDKQVKAGNLFAGYPSDWKEDPHLRNPEKLSNEKVWATFLAVNGNAAEMRAIERTDELAKLLAKGSDKDSGGFIIKAEKDCNEKIVNACEAAMDAMSYHSMFPGRIATSCMGVNYNLAVKAAIDALEHNYKFYLGFDNDQAGIEAAVGFQKKMIEEIGDEDYYTELNAGNIKYFELGIRCLFQSLKHGERFYLDVKNNENGMEAVKMFQRQLSTVMPKEKISELVQQGKIKYINIEPIYQAINNPREEAQNTLNLLNSGKPYYLVLKQPSKNFKNGEEHDVGYEIALKNFNEFKKELFTLLGDKKSTFENDGKIIYKKIAFAKDWNDYYNLMQKDPKFVANQKEICERYEHYLQQDNVVNKKFSLSK